ncbi:MAG TPA: hypothetical protein DCM87_16440 [Planctomycetes bacterium]|nr:hypothetical protein [Planctomycetota bacterium]
MFKLIKWTAVGVGGALILGGLMFGTDMFGYASSSYKQFRNKVKSAVPVELEIQRARDLLAELVPELKANIVLVAQEEVAVDELEKEISKERVRVASARDKMRGMKDSLAVQPVAYAADLGRARQVEALAMQLERVRLAEKLLEGKDRVLITRKKSLDTAIQALKSAQVRKVELEGEIERLEHDVRLMKLENQGPKVCVEQTSLAKAERLVAELRKRLEVAQKVLASGAVIDEDPPAPPVSEEEIICRVSEYLGEAAPAAPAVTLAR